MNEKRIQSGPANDHITLLAYVQKPDGSAFIDANGATITVELAPQFGASLGVYVDQTGSVSTVIAAASGQVGTPDPRWNPIIDGENGFTVAVTVPGSLINSVGLYSVRMNVAKNGQAFSQIWDIRTRR